MLWSYRAAGRTSRHDALRIRIQHQQFTLFIIVNGRAIASGDQYEPGGSFRNRAGLEVVDCTAFGAY